MGNNCSEEQKEHNVYMKTWKSMGYKEAAYFGDLTYYSRIFMASRANEGSCHTYALERMLCVARAAYFRVIRCPSCNGWKKLKLKF